MNEVLNIYVSTARSAYQAGNFEMSERFLKSAIHESKRQGSDNDVIAAFTENLAESKLKQNKTRSAIAMFKRSLEMRSKNSVRYKEHLVRVSYRLADVYLRNKFFQNAEFYFKKALAEELKEVVNPVQLRRLAMVLDLQGKSVEAQTVYSALSALLEATSGNPACRADHGGSELKRVSDYIEIAPAQVVIASLQRTFL